ncbi:MAG: hypothetical protein QOF01_3293, partial [Thermomicrobiales bacterium]|nr:hypothetical protein [Thermomicrobiales bacterium]
MTITTDATRTGATCALLRAES